MVVSCQTFPQFIVPLLGFWGRLNFELNFELVRLNSIEPIDFELATLNFEWGRIRVGRPGLRGQARPGPARAGRGMKPSRG